MMQASYQRDADHVAIIWWFDLLKPRMRRLAKFLAAGETTSVAASKFKVSRGRISQLRRELRDAWLKFQNEPAVA